MAHFFVVVGGSKIHERMAHFFIDIYRLGKARNIFYVFLLYLQKVHNLSVKKGRFLRKILAKIALNRKRAGSSPPWQEKYLSVPHQKMGSKKPRNR